MRYTQILRTLVFVAAAVLFAPAMLFAGSSGGASGGSSGPADALAPAVVIEGATADGFEGNFAFTDPTADWTATFGATGNITAGTGGTYTAPAFKLPGGAGGMYDDWGTGGVAIAFASATSFSLTTGGTYKLFIDTDEFQMPTGMKLGWGTIGGAHDVGLSRASAGVLNITDGNSGSGSIGKVASVNGGSTGTSQLLLDGDSTVSGDATVLSGGQVFSYSGFFVDDVVGGDYQAGLSRDSRGSGSIFLYPNGRMISGSTNRVAVRNASTAQGFEVYGTGDTNSDSFTNYERVGLYCDGSADCTLAAETAGTGADDMNLHLSGAGAGAVLVAGCKNWGLLASPPATCDAGNECAEYSDTSHARCYCDGTTWNVLTGSGAGACS